VGRTSRPVRRILSHTHRLPGYATGAAIHLGLPSPAGSSGLPAGSGGQPSNACAGRRLATPALLTLLRVGFTEPSRSPGMLVGSYPTVSPLPGVSPPGGLFSVALSRGSPRVAVNNHPALWSPDVPRQQGTCPPLTRPPGRLVRPGSIVRSPRSSLRDRLAEPLGSRLHWADGHVYQPRDAATTPRARRSRRIMVDIPAKSF
jgi:hypothetical protein